MATSPLQLDARTAFRPLCQISLAEQRRVMALVPRDDIHESSNRDFLPVRFSSARLFFVTEMLGEMNRCRANHLELVDQIIDRPLTEVRVRRPQILVKARKLGLVISCESNGAVRHDPLDIDHVPYDFLDAPLAGRIREIGAVGGNGTEHRRGLYQLLAQLPDQISIRDARDILRVKLGVFVAAWTPDGGAFHCSFVVELTQKTLDLTLFG